MDFEQHPRDWSEGLETYDWRRDAKGDHDYSEKFDIARGVSVVSEEHAMKVAVEQRQKMLREAGVTS